MIAKPKASLYKKKPKIMVSPEWERKVIRSLVGRMGRGCTSEAKKRAARLNGLKGGRPKKRQLEMKLEP